MRWSFPIGRLAGIPLRIHYTFILLPVFSAWLAQQATGEGRVALWVTAMTLLLFACVVLHELGHCVVAQRLGARVHSITLLPIGGVASMARLPERPRDEAWIAIAGPLVNAAIVLALLPVLGWEALRSGWDTLPSAPADLPGALMRANFVLLVFNLLPAFPMDGGRLLRAALASVLPYARATDLAARIGRIVALLFIAIGLGGLPMLAVAGAFVFLAAGRESGAIQVREKWHGRPVREAMHAAAILAPGDDLLAALARTHAGEGPDFVVMQDGQLLGLLPRERWLNGLRAGAGHRPAHEFMQSGFMSVRPDADLGRAWFDLSRHRQTVFPVMEEGHLVGLLEFARLTSDPGRAQGAPSGRGGRYVTLG